MNKQEQTPADRAVETFPGQFKKAKGLWNRLSHQPYTPPLSGIEIRYAKSDKA